LLLAYELLNATGYHLFVYNEDAELSEIINIPSAAHGTPAHLELEIQ
jgi:hypothetical protein